MNKSLLAATSILSRQPTPRLTTFLLPWTSQLVPTMANANTSWRVFSVQKRFQLPAGETECFQEK